MISDSYKSNIDGDYIPKNLDDAISEIDKQASDSSKNKIKTMSEKEFLAESHFGSGLGIRNNWHLWNKSRLKRYFNRKDIYHPDDMSGIILKSYYRHLNKKDIDLKNQIKYYQDYWEGVEITRLPKPKKHPEDNLKFGYSMYYGSYTKNKKWACVYIQTNSASNKHWIYDYYYGWKQINSETKTNLMKEKIELTESKMDSIFK